MAHHLTPPVSVHAICLLLCLYCPYHPSEAPASKNWTLLVCSQGGIAVGYSEDTGARQSRKWAISPASPWADVHTDIPTTPAAEGRASVNKTCQPVIQHLEWAKSLLALTFLVWFSRSVLLELVYLVFSSMIWLNHKSAKEVSSKFWGMPSNSL